jgi:pyruvate dehydrogenase E2 component (dihydrolipoamide acetyltransferase)
MPVAVAMPKLGMTMEEGTVVEWRVAPGGRVAEGEVVVVIESDKAANDLEAPASGVLRHVYVEVDETVACGTLLGAITDEADDDFDADAFLAAYEPPVGFESRPLGAEAVAASVPPPSIAAPVAARHSRGTPVTPAARALARRLGIATAGIPGSGPGGRVVRADVAAWAERRARLRPVAEGVALDVPTEGEGEPVVLLPGFGSDASVFAQQTETLTARHRVLGVNPRGVAGSDAPADTCYGVDQAARDVAALITESAHVIGASLGAAVAIELALTAPDKVRSLTLVTPFVEADARLLAVCESWARLAGEVPPASLASALVPWLFSPEALADDHVRRRIQRGLAVTLARVPAVTLERTLAGLAAWSGTRAGDLGRLAVPTLVVVAGGDLLTRDSASVASAIPGARCVEVAGAGHAVTIEAPGVVGDAIASHLALVEKGPHR